MKKKRLNKTSIIWILIIIGFCAMEFPGVLFFGYKAYPFVFGIPFIYSYIFFCWIYMCIIIFYAYKTNWGKSSFIKKKL
ncbi:hypothetical protein [Anaerovorax odorimutans]|uniref:hypothetical protein n=1 Tax=Anaerovorax odorimutans TaxID=109327 RepID=UPI00040FDD74|nr:hypothetical protein [Anaerovorax odorimutans]